MPPRSPDPLWGQVIWKGKLEWHEKELMDGWKDGDQQILHSVACSASTRNGLPGVKPENWPPKLTMQLIPNTVMLTIQKLFRFRNSKYVLFHPNDFNSQEALTKMAGTGFAGCVHFPGHCDIKVLILLFQSDLTGLDNQRYLGWIPDEQPIVVEWLRTEIERQKVEQSQSIVHRAEQKPTWRRQDPPTEEEIDKLVTFIEGTELTDGRAKKKKKKKKGKQISPTEDPAQLSHDSQPPAGALTPIDDSDHQNQDSDFPQEGSASHPLQLGPQPRQEEYEENFKQEKEISHDHKRLTVKGEGVTDEALGLPGDLTGPEHELLPDDDAIYQGELGSLEAELKDKEVKWQTMWESDQALVEKKGEEMSMLLSGIETTEEKKHFMLKKVADIEATMGELQGKKDELVAVVKNKDEKLNKMLEKKKRLETFIDGKVSESKAARRMLEKEMEETG